MQSYVTSYYKEEWGFCISQNDFNSLKDGEYKVKIDINYSKGNLTMVSSYHLKI